MEKKVLIFAHRGASKLAPENTLRAFQKAIELGADYVEFDVHETKDGEIVIIHDDDVERTAGIKGKIKEMTLKELKELDFGGGEKIPTLKELIELAKDKIGLQCEIKVRGIAKKIVEYFKEADLIDSTIISSFIHDELLAVKKYAPEIKLAPLVFGIKKNKMIREAIEHKYYAIHPFYKFINQKFLDEAHKNNIKINTWTVDSKSRMKKLIEMGIDGIITNDVELAKEVLSEFQ
ncbi:MAG: glycerophosphodiester phosphodiesterase [Promethearchaeota archaeon]